MTDKQMVEYKITNIGCDDETDGIFVLTTEQYEFLDTIFKILNENSHYDCMPKIYIDRLE